MHFTAIEHLEGGKAIYQCDICEQITAPAKQRVSCGCVIARGWGDLVKAQLSAIGIKQNGCGGCGNRQKTLNQFGWSITGAVMSTGRYVRDTIRAAIRNP